MSRGKVFLPYPSVCDRTIIMQHFPGNNCLWMNGQMFGGQYIGARAGDSGAPILQKDNNNRWQVLGVYSGGDKGKEFYRQMFL